MELDAGFREHAHTADWELEVWAPDLPGLLIEAARGMQSLCGMRLEAGPRQTYILSLDGSDAENLLVHFLSELLWVGEQEKLGFDHFELDISGQEDPLQLHNPLHLEAHLQGAPLAGIDKEIKAVTYHNLAVRQTRNGLVANIVFDV